MNAVVHWTRLDVRRRWRALAVLALLVALAGGVVIAVVAGARRTDTVIPRLQTRIAQADVMVLPNQPGFDWSKVRALPTVKALGNFVLGDGPQGVGFDDSQLAGFPAGDHVQNVVVDKPALLSGRLPDPDNPDEILVTPGFTAKYGRTLTMRMPSDAQLATIEREGGLPDGTAYAGRTIHLHVVGVGVNTFDLGPGGGPVYMPTYGFFRDYIKPYFNYFENARVLLRHGAADIPAFTKQLAAVTGNPDIEVADQRSAVRGLNQTASFTAKGWLLFAVAALLASLVLIGQAFVRFSAGVSADLQTLAALGLDRRQARAAAAAGPVLAGTVGAVAAIGVAIGLSPLFPTGLVGPYEPQPGVSVDGTVIGLGVLALLLLSVLGAWWSGRLAVVGRAEPVDRRSIVAAAVNRLGLGVPAVLGTRFALEPGRGATRVPVRPALIGAVAGVLGVVGALTFRTGIIGTTDNPDRFGQTLHEVGFVSEGAPDPSYAKALQQVKKDPDIAVLDDMRVDVFDINGTGVTTFSLSPVVGQVPIVVRKGHVPQSNDEIAIGPGVASSLHVHVGSTVHVADRTLTVSGITFVPVDPHNGYTDGAWLLGDVFNQLQPDLAKDKFHEVRFNFKPGVNEAAALKRLPAGLAPGGAGSYKQFVPIEEQTELHSVRVQPLLLGGFLVLLAIAAVGHGLATAVRRRRHDVAVLRAVGMTRRQARLTVAVQATVLAVAGLVLGIPLGIAAGRSSWEWLANATPVVYVAPLAVIAILLAIPGAVVASNLLAALPGRRAARLHVADVLRAE